MTLQQADFDQIITVLKPQFDTWLAEQSLEKPPRLYEMEMRERIVRVEEELKHQRELMLQGFATMDKRSEQILEEMNKRFEQGREEMNKRFEQMDKRFEQGREEMNKRFEQMDRHFKEMSRRIDRFMLWTFGGTLTSAGIVIAVLKL